MNSQIPSRVSSFSRYAKELHFIERISAQAQDNDPQLAQDLVRKEFPLKGDLRALSVISKDVVWVSGSEGNVFRTVNGGADWQACPIDSKADFRSFHAFNAREACAASAGYSEEGKALVYRTQDGGESWQKVLDISERGFFISGMAFWNADQGLLFCDPVEGFFRFFITKDGGCTWELMERNPQLQALQGEGLFAASNTCMALHGDAEMWFATGGGERARIFHSNDGGKYWEVYETPIKGSGKFSGIFSLAFRTPLEGIAVGGDYQNPAEFSSSNMIMTHDGGRSWQPLYNDRFNKMCLFCAAWDNDQPIIVEGSSKTFHTVVSSHNQLWLAGPDKVALITQVTS